MKTLNCLLAKSIRLFGALPLVFGLLTLMTTWSVQAVTIESVNIIDGKVDVTQGGFVDGNDDALNILLICNHTPIQVDIINGFVDVDEDGIVGETTDDLLDCTMNDETDGPAGPNNGIPTTNQVDIRDGTVDVDEDAVLREIVQDDALDIQLLKLP